MCSTPQKQPAANVAVSEDVDSEPMVLVTGELVNMLDLVKRRVRRLSISKVKRKVAVPAGR